MSSKTISPKTLKYDINLLLTLYNQVDKNQTGIIPKKSLMMIFQLVQLNTKDYEQYLLSQYYEFDTLLSILGQIQIPEQPSIYVLSFIRILANYRQKCLQQQNLDISLQDAKVIDQKIEAISAREIERQKNRLLEEHSKIYEEMHKSQIKQYQSFEEEWKIYLSQFQYQSYQSLKKNQLQRQKKLNIQSLKIQNIAKKTTRLTSPTLKQLQEKKKWLIKDGRYGKAIQINDLIHDQKRRLSSFYAQKIDQSVRKKVKSMQKKNAVTLQFLEMNSSINMNKLLIKKKQGENIMKIRMKNLREEAKRKLNQHLRNQISRLKSSLILASKG